MQLPHVLESIFKPWTSTGKLCVSDSYGIASSEDGSRFNLLNFWYLKMPYEALWIASPWTQMWLLFLFPFIEIDKAWSKFLHTSRETFYSLKSWYLSGWIEKTFRWSDRETICAMWSLCLSIPLLFKTPIWWKVQEDGEEHNLASFLVKIAVSFQYYCNLVP